MSRRARTVPNRHKIRITADYDWKAPGKRSWTAYKRGMIVNVTSRQRDDLIAAGVAEVAK